MVRASCPRVGVPTTDLSLYLHSLSAFWAGEETRAKDAKDAKVKGIKDDERDKVPVP